MIRSHQVADVFSPAECAALIDAARRAPAREARLVGQTRDTDIRRAELVWLDDLPGMDWAMDRLSETVREAKRAQGGVIVFPAFLLHRVTPVTAGVRHSLTLWAHGPAFR